MNKWTNGARRTMAVLGVAFGLLSVSAQADDRVLGAVIGGSAGAVIGHTVNGRNGALVGGASLVADEFAAIIRYQKHVGV